MSGGASLTRAEASAALTAAGIAVDGQRLPYLLMHAELEAVICSGPRKGKQHTWALLEERAPGGRDLPPDEALGELARRYFTGHGPATAKDLATWASLTLAEVRTSIEAAGLALRREDRAGVAFWASAGEATRSPALHSPVVRLVQGYDEYIMGYTETKSVIAPTGRPWSPADRPPANLVILVDGRIAGYWRRTIKRHEVVIEAGLCEPFDDAQMAALEAETARYGTFLGLPAKVVLAPAVSAGP